MRNTKATAMFARVEEWKRSGSTMQEFASSIGLTKSCFEYWVRKKRKLSVDSPQFVELITKDNEEQLTEYTEQPTQAQIVFTFPSGLCVKVFG